MNEYIFEYQLDLDDEDIDAVIEDYYHRQELIHQRRHHQFVNEREAGNAELYYHQQANKTRLERE